MASTTETVMVAIRTGMHLHFPTGLMISGFARAAQVLQDSAHLDRAVAAAHFIKQHLYKAETGVLVRNGYRDSNGWATKLCSPHV